MENEFRVTKTILIISFELLEHIFFSGWRPQTGLLTDHIENLIRRFTIKIPFLEV